MRCEVAVFNLSGYQRGHPGLEFEIKHVLSGGPPQRCVFMYDRRTDADGAIDTVLSVFAAMEQKRPLLFLRYSDTQNAGYAAQFGTPKQRTRAGYFTDMEGPYRPIAAVEPSCP